MAGACARRLEGAQPMNALPQLPPEGSPARRELEKTARNIAAREVCLNVTGLVSDLAGGQDAVNSGQFHSARPLAGLCDQAAALWVAVDDWEEAARQAGWAAHHNSRNHENGVYFQNAQTKDIAEASPANACGWEDLCREVGLDPYPWEVFECWAVSQSLGEDLAALGEKVDDDFAGLVVWARTTTGVSFSGDDLFLRVAQLIQQRAEADCWDDEPDLEGASSTEAGRYAAKAAGKMLGPKP